MGKDNQKKNLICKHTSYREKHMNVLQIILAQKMRELTERIYLKPI